MTNRKETRIANMIEPNLEIVRHLNKNEACKQAYKAGYSYAEMVDDKLCVIDDCCIAILLKNGNVLFAREDIPFEGKLPKRPSEVDSIILVNPSGYEFYGKNVQIIIEHDDDEISNIRLGFIGEILFEREEVIPFESLPLYGQN